MTVFKGFLTITKRNLNILIMYIAIFMIISLMVQKSLGSDDPASFEQESLDIAVIDRDGGQLARGLREYLGSYHNIKDMPDDKSVLQDRLFYREVYYIATIPENFEERCLVGDEKIPVTKVPESSNSYYVDQQINTFLNDVRIMTESGFSLSDAIAEVQKNASEKADVTLLDDVHHAGETPDYAYMFQYMPYILLSIVCYILSYIMIAFQKPDVKKRMLCSAISIRRQNIQLVLGCAVIGLLVWGLCILMPVIVYQKAFLTDAHLPYYLLNAFLMTLVSLAIAFLISAFLQREDVISPVVNVVSLGMSFICGVFVSMDILSKGVKAVARFLPAYWYEICNHLLSSNDTLSSAQLRSLYTGYGIQLLFSAAFLGIALVVLKSKRQAQE